MFSDVWLMLYLAERVEFVSEFLGVICTLSFMALLASLVFRQLIDGEIDPELMGKLINLSKYAKLPFIVSIIILAVLPSKEVIFVYTSGKAVDQALESAKESGIPQRALNTLNKVFDKIYLELTKEEK